MWRSSVSGWVGGLLIELPVAAGLFLLYRQRTQRQTARTVEKFNQKFLAEIADRRAIERELAHLASFSEMAPNPIIETDTSLKIHYLNPAALVEFPDAEKLGSKHPVFDGLDAVLSSLQGQEKAVMTRPIKIGARIYDQQVALLDGGPGVRLYFSDITELKRLDQLKTDFVNMVSHELRSPLTSIQAGVKMVVSQMLGGLNKDQADILSMVLFNVDRLGRLINELLDISKIEAGKLELRWEPVKISALVENIGRTFAPLARERGLTLLTRSPEEPLETFLDRDKITEVFTNLAQNALKFTEKGSIEISVQLTEGEIRCQVADTGPGISAQDLPKVFQKFHQFGASPHGREKGTGLGLSLCKGIVELHGGRIWVESEPDKGSRFIFVIPRVSAETIFNEQVRTLYQQAVSQGQPLTLVSFALERWTVSVSDSKDDAHNVVMDRLEAVVKSLLGQESVIVVRRRGGLWVALPEIAKAAAQDLARRVLEDFEQKPAGPTASPAESIAIKLASYPEDGTLPEELFRRIATA